MSHDLDAVTRPPGSITIEPPDRPYASRPARHQPARWLPLLVGLLVGLLVAGAGVVYANGHPATWSTHREVVIVPRSGAELSEAASLYDSLSRGQVVATAAQIYGQARWHPETPDVTVTAGDIPPSAVVQVTASGADRSSVSTTVDAVIASATPEVNRALTPYRAVTLADSAPSPEQVGLGRNALLVVALLAGLLAGVLGAGAVRRLTGRRR